MVKVEVMGQITGSQSRMCQDGEGLPGLRPGPLGVNPGDL